MPIIDMLYARACLFKAASKDKAAEDIKIEVYMSSTIEIHVKEKKYFDLQQPLKIPGEPLRKDFTYTEHAIEKHNKFKLSAIGITNCLVVIIRDVKLNRYWMLHIAPDTVRGYGGLFGVVQPALYRIYAELKKEYVLKDLGLGKDDVVDIIVVNRSVEDVEPTLRATLEAKINSIRAVPLAKIGADVTFCVTDNSLQMEYGNKVLKTHPNVFSTDQVDEKPVASPQSN